MSKVLPQNSKEDSTVQQSSSAFFEEGHYYNSLKKTKKAWFNFCLQHCHQSLLWGKVLPINSGRQWKWCLKFYFKILCERKTLPPKFWQTKNWSMAPDLWERTLPSKFLKTKKAWLYIWLQHSLWGRRHGTIQYSSSTLPPVSLWGDIATKF